MPSSSTPQRAALTSKHEPTPRRRLLQPPAKVPAINGQESHHMSSLPSHAPRAAAPTSRCKTPRPRMIQAPRSKRNRQRRLQSHDENPKRDAFMKGATSMAPLLQGFHPCMRALEGKTMPPTGKVAPTGVTIVEAFAQRSPRSRRLSAKKLGLHPTSTAIAIVLPLYRSSSEGHRRASCAKQPHSCVGHHPPPRKQPVEPGLTPPYA